TSGTIHEYIFRVVVGSIHTKKWKVLHVILQSISGCSLISAAAVTVLATSSGATHNNAFPTQGSLCYFFKTFKSNRSMKGNLIIHCIQLLCLFTSHGKSEPTGLQKQRTLSELPVIIKRLNISIFNARFTRLSALWLVSVELYSKYRNL
ncbi:hypothetical protein L9F63_025047, partial [Diploptera punctata]